MDMPIANMIDHTLLRTTATEGDIVKLCDEAKKYGFAAVCVNPIFVPLARKQLRGTGVKVCTVIGFPTGAITPRMKAFEAKEAIENGAQEIDMVMNIGAMKSGNYKLVREDIEGVVKEAKRHGVVVKVIIETCYLTDDEKVQACLIAKEAGAEFVKSSTGWGTSGATIHDVQLIRKAVGNSMGVKASGGIRTLKDALAMVKAGANRIGTSAGVAIAKEELKTLSK